MTFKGHTWHMAKNIQGEPTAAGGTFQFHILTVNRPTVYFAVRVRTPDGSLSPLSNIAIGSPSTQVSILPVLPMGALSLSAVPNPSNPSTRLTYNLPGVRSVQYPVRLRVYDLSGRLLRTLVDAKQAAGTHAVSWNGKDDHGTAAGSGIYLFKISAGGRDLCRKFMMVK